MNIVTWYVSDLHACGHIRAEVTAREINKNFPNWLVVCKSEIMISDFFKSNIMVFQRQSNPHALEKMKLARQSSVKCIYELDDDMFNMPPEFVKPYAYYSKPEVQKIMNLFVMNADEISVTTKHLADAIRPRTLGQNINVIPNFIDIDKWNPSFARKQNSKSTDVTIGWMASGSHKIDAPLVNDVLYRLMKKHANLKMHFIGWLAEDDFPWIKEYKNRCRVDKWIDISVLPLAMEDFDIGLAPLVDNTFNRSKCLVGDTRIVTDSGVSTIKCILKGASPSIKIWQEHSYKNVSTTIKYASRPTVKIITKKGYSIEGTHNHKLRSDGKFVEMSELSIGSNVDLSFFEYPSVDYVKVAAPFMRTKSLANLDKDALDESMCPSITVNERWGRFIGYVLGDGTIGSSPTVSIACDAEYPDVMEDICLLAKQIGTTSTISYKRSADGECSKRSRGIQIHGRNLNWIFANKFMMWNDKDRKILRIPDVIWKSPKSVMRECIRGLFETDGTVSKEGACCSLTTKSIELARDVQFALMGFGIISCIRNGYNKVYKRWYYTVTLNRQACDVFNREIGFISKRKSELLSKISLKRHSNSYKEWSMSDEVKSITHGNADVYDVEIPDGHYYMANGMVSHNSNIKLLQHSALGIPTVASPLNLYAEDIVDGESGFLAHDEDDWFEYLDKLILDKQLRMDIGHQARTMLVNKYDIKLNVGRWIEMFNNILKDKR